MESFQVTVVYLWLAGMGALVVLVLYASLSAAAEGERAHSRATAAGTAATESVHRRRAVA